MKNNNDMKQLMRAAIRTGPKASTVGKTLFFPNSPHVAYEVQPNGSVRRLGAKRLSHKEKKQLRKDRIADLKLAQSNLGQSDLKPE